MDQEKFAKITGNPYGVSTESELIQKMDKMNKNELISFATKLGVKTTPSEQPQDIKQDIIKLFKIDPRKVNILDMPKPKKFDLDLNDEKVRKMFNIP